MGLAFGSRLGARPMAVDPFIIPLDVVVAPGRRLIFSCP
jgi:hypothetical protein